MKAAGLFFTKKENIYDHNISYIKWLEVFSSFYFLIPVWVSFELKFINLSQLALIEVAIAASLLILELPTGALADLIGRKNTIAMGYFIGFVSYLMFAFSTNFTQFLITAFLFGLFESLISGSKEALVFDTLKEAKRENEFSKLTNYFQIRFHWGMALATLLGGFLYQIDFHLPAVMNALTFLVCAIITMQLREPSIDSEKFTLKNYIKQTKEGFKELFKSKKAKDASLFYILVGGLTWPTVVGLKNVAFTSLGFSEAMIGMILPIISLSSVYFLHFLLKKEKFENVKFTYILLALLPVIGLTLGFWLNVYLIIPMILLLSFTSSARWNVLGKLTNSFYSSKNRATAISSLNMSISIIYVTMMGLFSWLSSSTEQSLNIIFAIMAALSFLFLLPMGIKLAKRYGNKQVELEDQIGSEFQKSQAEAISSQ